MDSEGWLLNVRLSAAALERLGNVRAPARSKIIEPTMNMAMLLSTTSVIAAADHGAIAVVTVTGIVNTPASTP